MKYIQKYRIITQLLSIILTALGFFIDFQFTLNILLVTSIFAGVFHCGWICPFGTIQELSAKLGRFLNIKKRTIPSLIHSYLVYMRYIMFVIFMVFTFDFVFRIIAFDPRANFTILLTGNLLTLGSIIILVFFTLISLFYDRPFCNYLCIEGAKYGLLSSFRFFTIHRNDISCIDCKKCDKVCSMHIKVSSTEFMHSPSCINCFECISACPVENTLTYSKIEISPKIKKHYITSFYIIAMGIAVFFLYNLAISNQVESSKQAHRNPQYTSETPGMETAESKTSDYSNSQLNESPSIDFPHSTEINLLNDGIYSGDGIGFRGIITVEMVIKDGSIESVKVTNHREDYRWFNRANNIIPSSIIEAQSTDVDIVSGATYSSKGIIEGATNAIESAVMN